MHDRRIDAIARRQHGAFNRKQALEVGLTPRMIEHRRTTKAWLTLDRGVYALASHPFTWERQAMAATLSIAGAVLSGRSAAALHRIAGFQRGSLEITVPRPRNGRSALATVRRTDFMQASKVNRIPCLTVAHTILSIANGRSVDLDRAIDDVLVRRMVALDELQDRFATWAPRRHPGVDRLRRMLAERGDGRALPTSALERELRSFLNDPVLPGFVYEYELPWWSPGHGRVDAYAPEHRLIVEVDGRAWHTRERDFVKDRRRDNLATANGHATLRFTWVDLTQYHAENRLLLRQTIGCRPIAGVVDHL